MPVISADTYTSRKGNEVTKLEVVTKEGRTFRANFYDQKTREPFIYVEVSDGAWFKYLPGSQQFVREDPRR